MERKLHFLLWVVPLVVLLAVAVIQFSEWWKIGVVADPREIARYPFGAEGPVAGNPAYESPDAYARHALWGWVSCVVLAGIFAFAGLRHSIPLLCFGYISLVIAFLVVVLI